MMTMKEAKALIASVVALRNFATDEQALTMMNIFPNWKVAQNYEAGARLVYGGALYRVVATHISESSMTPDIATDLYSRVVAE